MTKINLTQLTTTLDVAVGTVLAAYPQSYASASVSWEGEEGELRTLTLSANAPDDDGDDLDADLADLDPEEDERIATMG